MGATQVPKSATAHLCTAQSSCPRHFSLKSWAHHVERNPRLHRPRQRKSFSTRAAEAAEQTLEDVKPAFDRCTTEVEFLQTLKSALNHPKAPDFLFPAFHDFYDNYKGVQPCLL